MHTALKLAETPIEPFLFAYRYDLGAKLQDFSSINIRTAICPSMDEELMLASDILIPLLIAEPEGQLNNFRHA
jgi:hypothetical protein